MRAREREREREITCVCAFVSCPFVCVRIFRSERKRQRETKERDERGGIIFHFKTSSFSSQEDLEETRREKKGPTRVTNLSVDLLSLSLPQKSRERRK